jgi:exportin-1
MAVNTFLKIAETCKAEFVIVHQNSKHGENAESEPYIDELLRRIYDETNMLELDNKLVFYEAVGHMISSEKNF